MTGETLNAHFDALVEDIRTVNVQEACDIVAADKIEIEHLAATSPRLADELRPIVQDEDYLRVAAESCQYWPGVFSNQRAS